GGCPRAGREVCPGRSVGHQIGEDSTSVGGAGGGPDPRSRSDIMRLQKLSVRCSAVVQRVITASVQRYDVVDGECSWVKVWRVVVGVVAADVAWFAAFVDGSPHHVAACGVPLVHVPSLSAWLADPGGRLT